MGWILAAVLGVMTLLNPAPVSWGDVYENTHGAISPLYGVQPNGAEQIVCTVVNVEGWLTSAKHCFPGPGKGWVYTDYGAYDGTYIASALDFVIIGRAPKDVPYLELADETPRRGDELALVGYGWGEPSGPIMTIGHAQGFLNHAISNYGYHNNPHIWWYSNEALIAGQSGGAVMTTDGKYITVGSFFDAHPAPQAWLAGSPSPQLVRELLHAVRNMDRAGVLPAPGNPLVWEDRVVQTLGAPQLDYVYP